MNTSTTRTFWVKVYRTDKTFFKDGQNMQVHCQHVNNGNFGMNTDGEIVALPGATVVTQDTSPPTDVIVPVTMDPQGTVYPSPTQFGDSGFKAVTKIKDTILLEEFIVDTDSYNANVVTCNPVSACQSPYLLFADVQTNIRTVTQWNTGAGVLGSEYVVNTSGAFPTGDGTFTNANTLDIVTVPNTAYYFWVRTVCSPASKSGWTSIAFRSPM